MLKKKLVICVFKLIVPNIVLNMYNFLLSSDLEKTGTNIGPVQMFSNIDNLSLDPVDKNTVTHSQLLQSYKWTNKVISHSYSNI